MTGRPPGLPLDDPAPETNDKCVSIVLAEPGDPPASRFSEFSDADACTSGDACDGAGVCSGLLANLDVTGFSGARIDGRDLVVLADAWTSCPGDDAYNAGANFDRVATMPGACIDMTDFHLFMNSFGHSCP